MDELENKRFDENENQSDFSDSFEKYMNSNEEIKSNKKGNRLDEAKWTLEEEYLFFEAQTIMGNKWTYLNSLLPNKTAKQLKNHFYSSIVKTLRRIVKNKYECIHIMINLFVVELKDMVISYYSLIYLKQLFLNKQYLYIIQTKKDRSPQSNVTLKKLILSKDISLEKIESYSKEFESQIVQHFKTMYEFDLIQTIPQMFNEIIKAKLLYQCMTMVQANQINSEKSCNLIYKYVEEVFSNK